MTEKQPVLIIYNDGSMEKAEMPAGALRNIGQQIIAMVDNAVMAGNIPTAVDEEVQVDND